MLNLLKSYSIHHNSKTTWHTETSDTSFCRYDPKLHFYYREFFYSLNSNTHYAQKMHILVSGTLALNYKSRVKNQSESI